MSSSEREDSEESDASESSQTLESRSSESRRWKNLTVDERRDFVSSLEHIVTFGSLVHHSHVNALSWQRQRDTSVSNGGQKLSTNLEASPGSKRIHAEDQRIYGGMNPTWPRYGQRIRKRQKNYDVAWNEEHGDEINMKDFYQNVLKERDKMNGQKETLQVPGSDENDGPLEFLVQRCWERAVHASSCTVECDNIFEESENSASLLEANLDNRSKGSKTYADAVKQCAQLNIELSPDEPFVCPTCDAVLESVESLRLHFYGGAKVRGCCWILIEREQRRLVETILKQEALSTTRRLLQIVLFNARERSLKQNGGEQKVFDWQDVLGFLETTLKSADSAGVDDSPAVACASGTKRMPELETLSFNPNELPVVLNQKVMEALRNRLVERYSTKPR